MNPRPRRFYRRLYMLSPSITFADRYPTDREHGQLAQLGFNESALDEPSRDPVIGDPRYPCEQAHLGAEASRL